MSRASRGLNLAQVQVLQDVVGIHCNSKMNDTFESHVRTYPQFCQNDSRSS